MAAHQLYLISLGRLINQNPSPEVAAESQVAAYLIRSARGKNILIDTGNPSSLIGAENAAPWAPKLGTCITEDDDIVLQLSKLGLRPKDIDLLVTTHFDFDHCGRHDAFAAENVHVLVQRSHFVHAMAHPKRYDQSLFLFDGWNYDLVDGDVEIERGIVLLETSGHAIGHQSVYVDSANGPVLLAIDAISGPIVAQTREFPSNYEDVADANKSIDKLMDFALDYRTYMIFGHELSQWDTLAHAPRVFSR